MIGERVQKPAAKRASVAAAPPPRKREKARYSGSGPARLDPQTRAFMEAGLGRPFDQVWIHTGSQAAAEAKRLNAHAFTVGPDIFFAPGRYRPETPEGKRLLAHELAHVAQQGGAALPGSQRLSLLPVAGHGDPMEREADAAALAVARGETARVRVAPAAGHALHRKGAEEEEEAGSLAKLIAGYAEDIPGFTLVSFILGRNPVTMQRVERNAKNLVGGVLGLVPGGNIVFKNLNESGALDAAFAWVSEQIEALNITWEGIKALVKQALAEVAFYKLGDNIAIVTKIFAPTYLKIKKFAEEAGEKLLHFVFEGALRLMGADPAKIKNLVAKAGDTVKTIVADPVRFLKNLLGALGKGFNQFSANIWEHLKSGLVGWLTGALEGTGVSVPKGFDLKSCFGFLMEVLGITRDFIHKKVARVIGERNLELIEKAWSFISTLMTSGISGLWEMLKEYLGNVKEMVLSAIQDWVVTKVVTTAIGKLVAMFNPVGALITAVQTIYNTVMFFVERIKQIMALVEAIVDSFSAIAKGALDQAANWVEKTMARTLPLIISFLARFLNLGGIGEKIKEIVLKLRERVDKAFDAAIDAVVKRVKAFVGKLLPGEKEDPKKAERNKQVVIGKVREALRKGIKGFRLWALLKYLKLRYRIKVLKMERGSSGQMMIVVINSNGVHRNIYSSEEQIEKRKKQKNTEPKAKGKKDVETKEKHTLEKVECEENSFTPFGALEAAFSETHSIIAPFKVTIPKWCRPREVKAVICSPRMKDGGDRGEGEGDVHTSGHVGMDEALLKQGSGFTFHGGHLIGHRFFGMESNQSWNVAPQIDKLNIGAYNRLERLIYKSEGRIQLGVKVDYEPDCELNTKSLVRRNILTLKSNARNPKETVKIPSRVPKCWTIDVKAEAGKTIKTLKIAGGKKREYKERYGEELGEKDWTWYEEPQKKKGDRKQKHDSDEKPEAVGGTRKSVFVFSSKTPMAKEL